ncbi:hypothetical protein [Zobellia alginiliquefaciens]|uniref:hypothetical protein n=1 Tax=Zobellia alginiliquefaciens TaxID=3032586 RepID=UPI0023E3EFCE|nr:hypothetical protein [Zobellia alginiliquefaciens]
MSYQISINQVADFINSSFAKKKRIIRQQKEPNPFRIAYYQLPKARIRKSVERSGDLEPILLGIEELKRRTLLKPRQINDRKVSLEAMRRFLSMSFPTILKNGKYEVIKKPPIRSIFINGVEVIISLDVILKMSIDGKTHLGGLKIHIAKTNVFDYSQQKAIAVSIYKYLNDVVANEGEIVNPKLCFSLDVFGRGIVSAPLNIYETLGDVEMICEEIKSLWTAA